MKQPKPTWRDWVTPIAGAAAVCGMLVWAGERLPGLLGEAPGIPEVGLGSRGATAPRPAALLEVAKLAAAAAIGIILTSLHRLGGKKKGITRSIQQSQILLCVAGALMMIIIGNSVARALGIAGGATIIRFRTPVKDTKEATLFLLLLGLGMACGLGAFAVAGLGTGFLAAFLLWLDRKAEKKTKKMLLELVAAGPALPAEHMQQVFARHRLKPETRELVRGEQTTVKYQVAVDHQVSLEKVSAELIEGAAPALKSVSWQAAKKKV